MSTDITWRNIRDSDFYLKVPDPVTIGPTWQQDPEWDGEHEATRYVLPRFTLGWQAAKWVGENLLDSEGEPFTLTAEQTRFLLHFYAVDETGKSIYRQAVMQRVKGWLPSPEAKASGEPGVKTRWVPSSSPWSLWDRVAFRVGQPATCRRSACFGVTR